MRWQNLDPRRWKSVAAQSTLSERAPVLDKDSASALAPHLLLGKRGEALAALHLEEAGYRLVASNFTLPVGRNLRGAIVHAEIDIVAYDGPTLCFIEVKTRASDWFAPPEANVDLRKQRQVSRAARAYRRMFGQQNASYRYDVVTVVVPHEDANLSQLTPRLELLRNFWTDDKFRKRRWSDTPYDF